MTTVTCLGATWLSQWRARREGVSRPARTRGVRHGGPLLAASAIAALVAMGCHVGAAQAAPRLKVLFSFTNLKGAFPYAGLIADDSGNLYGATTGGGANGSGVVFELSPPAAGDKHWSETVLRSFNQTHGNNAVGDVIADGAGNFYGTTVHGGANDQGVVFELSPPKGGRKAWTETVLRSFGGPDGEAPEAGLITDGAGNLYGTTSRGGAVGDGVVFELSPPKTGKKTWTETVLQSFRGADGQGPYGSLLADGAGNLYGATQFGGANGGGVVFELSPPAGGRTAWTETVLKNFAGGRHGYSSNGGLVSDAAGNLYGTAAEDGANGDGVVFELSPPGVGKKSWSETVLQSFDGPDGSRPAAGLILDGAGNLFGTTQEGGASGVGVVFELSPPKVGRKAWTETVLQSFNGTNGEYPAAGLIADGAGAFYGVTENGGSNGCGVVFKLTP